MPVPCKRPWFGQAVKGSRPPPPLCTGHHPLAGTDANVYLDLRGSCSQVQDMLLVGAGDTFERWGWGGWGGCVWGRPLPAWCCLLGGGHYLPDAACFPAEHAYLC